MKSSKHFRPNFSNLILSLAIFFRIISHFLPLYTTFIIKNIVLCIIIKRYYDNEKGAILLHYNGEKKEFLLMEYRLIQPKNIDRALEKAKQYRALLEPELAISICLDIFAVAENHQESLVIYILALTDTLSDHNVKAEKPDKKNP